MVRQSIRAQTATLITRSRELARRAEVQKVAGAGTAMTVCVADIATHGIGFRDISNPVALVMGVLEVAGLGLMARGVIRGRNHPSNEMGEG